VCIKPWPTDSKLPRPLAKYSLIPHFSTLLSRSQEASLNRCPLGIGARGSSHKLLISCLKLFTSPIVTPVPGKRRFLAARKRGRIVKHFSIRLVYNITTQYVMLESSRLGKESSTESGPSPMTLVSMSRTWLADDRYCIVVEARIMFTLAWVVRKCFSYAAAWVYFCRQNSHLLGITGVLSVDC